MIKSFRRSYVQGAYNHIHPAIPSPVSIHFGSEQSSNDYIKSLCEKNLYREALKAFDFLQNNTSFQLKHTSYAHLILACSSLRSLDDGRRIHNAISASNFQPDIILQNHVLNMYGKCGSLRDARKVFDEMPQRNAVSWTSLISGYSQNRQENEAIRLYIRMLNSDHLPDQFTFGSIVKACSGLNDMGLGRQLHAHVVKSECGGHTIAQNALISMYTNLGDISDASDIFSRIAKRDLISWGSIIAGCSQLGYELEALRHFKQMLSEGTYQPNEFVFGSVFSACSNLLQLDYGRQIHSLSMKYGLGRDNFTGCSICDMYAKCGFLCSARDVFYRMEEPDLVSWNAIICGFAKDDNAEEAVSFFSRMRLTGLLPNDVTLISLLCGFTKPVNLHQGKQIHSYLIKMGFDKEVTVCNILLTMYGRCSDFCDVIKGFEDMRSKADIVSWNAILTACMQQKKSGEAFAILKLMLCSHVKADHVTLSNIMGACGELASLEVGTQVHCLSVKTGLILDISVTNGLIDMYTKCGSLEKARKLFDLMENPDVVSWSSLIVGYAQSGCGNEALGLFRTMRDSGVEPNQVTFVGVLTACSHIGLVQEGLKLYQSMEKEYKVAATKEHCACMVDLLARSGCLDEAEDFINKMPFEPDIVAWKTLLASCQTHGNAEIGKRVAEKILKIDPLNSACRVLLCNINAASGDWGDVARLRSWMRQSEVRKMPGVSWIQVKKMVHVFFAEDSSHGERGEIYTMLHLLWMHVLDECHQDPLQMDQEDHIW